MGFLSKRQTWTAPENSVPGLELSKKDLSRNKEKKKETSLRQNLPLRKGGGFRETFP